MADIGPHQLVNISVSSSIAAQVVVRMIARRRAHVCEFCLEPHRTVECPRDQGSHPKVRVRGSTSFLGCVSGPRCKATTGRRSVKVDGIFSYTPERHVALCPILSPPLFPVFCPVVAF